MFAKPCIKRHAVGGQIGFQASKHQPNAFFLKQIQVGVGQSIAMLGLNVRCDVNDFFAKVAIVGNADILAQAICIACIDAQGQVLDLLAAIVDVKFFENGIPSFRQNARQVVTVGTTASVSNVQGSGWICGDVFEQDTGVVWFALAVRIGLKDVRDDRRKGAFVKGQVDEPWSRDRDRADRGIQGF